MSVDATTLFLKNTVNRHTRPAASPTNLAAQRALQRPRLAPDVMASAPTIAAATDTSSIASRITIAYNDPRLLFSGGVIVPRGSDRFGYNGLNLSPNHENSIGRFEVVVETQHFEVVTGGVGPNGAFRILINDQYVSTSSTLAPQNDNESHFFLVDLGSRQIVKLTVELEETALAGVTIDPTGNAWATDRRQPRVLFMGDSITEGIAAAEQADAWPQYVASRLGWEDPWVDGQGGSGYLAPGANGGTPFQPRMVFDYQYQPDVIVLFGGINDRPVSNVLYTPAALQAAVSALLTDIEHNAPVGVNSGIAPTVYVLGCWMNTGSPGADIIAANNAIKAAALAAGVTFIDTASWVTGTGHVGATTGVGNADFVISSADGLHPTDEGHKMIGWRVADAILATYPRIGA